MKVTDHRGHVRIEINGAIPGTVASVDVPLCHVPALVEELRHREELLRATRLPTTAAPAVLEVGEEQYREGRSDGTLQAAQKHFGLALGELVAAGENPTEIRETVRLGLSVLADPEFNADIERAADGVGKAAVSAVSRLVREKLD